MENLKIEYLPVESLKPYEKNARRHEEADVQTIVNSIREFGFDDPIGVWGDENLIVEGHGRLLAAKQLGMDKVPCIRLDHLTDEQRRAYALAHNKTAEMSAWDWGLLDSELDGILDIDMSDFGFEDDLERNQLGYINDLIGEDIGTSMRGMLQKDFFTISFAFPISEQDIIQNYIAKNGKDYIVDCIIRRATNAD